MIGNDSRKRGRPRKLEARINQVNVKLSNRELERVGLVAERYDISYSEVLRIAFENYFQNVF